MLLGLVVGAASGFLQFWMLNKFTKAVTGGAIDKKTVLFGSCQFLLPLVVLLGCAFLLRDSLLWAAIGMVLVLVLGSLIKLIYKKK